MRKLLHRFEHPWQAEIFQGLLQQEGIQSFKIEGAREYSTIVTGIGQPITELFVDDLDLEQSQKVLNNYLKTPHLHLVEDQLPEVSKEPENSFRKVFFFSAAGAVFLPVILNIVACVHLVKVLKRKEETLFRKFVATSVVLAGWAGAISVLYLLIAPHFE